MSNQELIDRVRTRARIRRQIPRPEPDRISKDLEDCADEIERLNGLLREVRDDLESEYERQAGADI